jgi:hypothetical protein
MSNPFFSPLFRLSGTTDAALLPPLGAQASNHHQYGRTWNITGVSPKMSGSFFQTVSKSQFTLEGK